VATLADEPARLISALHDTAPVPVAYRAPANLAVVVGGAPISRIAGLIRAARGQVNAWRARVIHGRARQDWCVRAPEMANHINRSARCRDRVHFGAVRLQSGGSRGQPERQMEYGNAGI
jgi:hypothetical protein